MTAYLGHTDTIVAIATPPGTGAISVVRLSGPLSRQLLRKHFRAQCSEMPPRSVVWGRFLDDVGREVDQVLATWFPGPRSYTGEDVVEISCHGSPLIAARVVEALSRSGGRFAEPGEFTKRAFLNGKLDLAQAEAVRDLVESQTAFQARLAAMQLEGFLSRALAPTKERLVRLVCQLESGVEFVEENLDLADRESLSFQLQAACAELEELAGGFRIGRVVREGIQVVISGKPNTGKSSVFNSLLRESRAIVTAVAGTTRDALAETISLSGVPTRLVDMAGIRRSEDEVEALGVEKTRSYLSEADVVLFVLDGSRELDEQDRETWGSLGKGARVVVVNKSDLPRGITVPEEMRSAGCRLVSTSALTGSGIEELRESILEAAMPGLRGEREGFFITNLRHKKCLDQCLELLALGADGLRSGRSEEFVLYDLRKALDCLGQITGETTVEDLLGEIFSTFCVGK